jgi:signal transduction histidine kinase
MKINRISYKIIVYILLVSLTITSISTYFQLKEEFSHQKEIFSKELSNIQENNLAVLANAIWTVDTKTINTLLKSLLNNEKIIYIEINDENNITSFGKKKTNNVIYSEFKIIKKLKSHKHILGKLIIIADLNPLKEQLNKKAIKTIFYELLKITLISLLIIYIIKQFITNYIEKMSRYADNLTLDNLHIPLKLKNDDKNKMDELDILSNSINTIRENLSKEIKKNRSNNSIMIQQSKMASMGEMISNIAHQWRQPLTAISALVMGLQIKIENDKYEKKYFDDKLERIDDSLQHLSRTIDDFKGFFKVQKEKKPFEMKQVFEKTLIILDGELKINQIEVITDIEDINIVGFESEFIQVLINIINNAIYELLKKDHQRLIFINTLSDEENIYVAIKDNAGGIPEDIVDVIFDPYVTTKQSGTGIGLYMSSEIIKKHMNGKILVENLDYRYKGKQYSGADFKIIMAKN